MLIDYIENILCPEIPGGRQVEYSQYFEDKTSIAECFGHGLDRGIDYIYSSSGLDSILFLLKKLW